MKKIILIVALMGSPTAFAGAFDDHYYVMIDGGIEYTAHSKFSGTTSDDISHAKFFGGLATGYSFKISPKINLGANVFFNMANNGNTSSSTISVTTRNNLGFSVEPGYYLNDKALAYAKIGYARMNAKLDDGHVAASNPLDGYLVGVGFKYLLDESAFVGAEVVHYEYGDNTVQLSSLTTYKADQNVGLITLAFQF
jgi:opacity protein-like surface antigen